jgi:rootletin
MFFLPIQASRRLISIKKRTKCSFFMNRLPNRQFPFGIPSGFYKRLAAYLGTVYFTSSNSQATHHIPWTYLGPTLDLPWTYLGPTLDLPWTYLGPTLDLPWTYEQFLTKLFVTTPKLSIVNCLRILNFL